MHFTVVVRSSSRGDSGGAAEDAGPSLTFDGGRIVVGRSPGCDVRLPDPSVSLRHASIRAQGAEYAVVDEGSTNGTWVGGVKLVPQTPRLVKSGDLVRVGRVWLELVIGARPATPDLGMATRDLALALVRNAMDAVGDDTCARLHVAEGPDIGAVLRLPEEGRRYVVGRAEHCDLPLADEDASREHAEIVRRGPHVLLRDLGSKNGIFLGDARLEPHREVVWRPQTMIRIGMSVLALDEPVSLALAELEGAADEPLPDELAPPAPPSSVAAGSAVPPPASARAAADEMPVGIATAAETSSRTAPTAVRKRRRAFRAADVAVVTIAALVIAASLAGLVWVLR